MFIHEALLDNQAAHATTRTLLQFCVSKIHALQAALLTANDNAEILETLAHMQTIQLSVSILTIALVSDDASIINQAKTLLRSVV